MTTTEASETAPAEAAPVATAAATPGTPIGIDTGSYLTRMEAASVEDRAYAADLSTRLIDVIKAFTAMKHRLFGAAHAEGYDFGLLLRLGKAGPMRASDLAEQLCADPSTVSRQVSGLVKAGLLDRQSDPHDGRASILVVTDAGRAKIADLVALRGKIFAPLIADWVDSDRARMLTLLERFSTDLLAAIDTLKTLSSDVLLADAHSRRTP